MRSPPWRSEQLALRLDDRARGPIVGCRSDSDGPAGSFGFQLDSIEVVGGIHAGTLKVGRAPDDKRRELIAAVRAGEQVSLHVVARTFRQKDGKPNRRGLRFNSEILGDVAGSFVGMPVLLDHNTWEQSARIGTIIASELYEQGDGWAGFRQTLEIVKPEAVISVLDGTLDRFSVGWIPTGPVLCSVHRTDVRDYSSRCCYPLDKVDTEDGRTTVEWEFQSAEGIEVSAVNVPAVKGTKIEDIRSALAAELGDDARETPTRGEAMSFTRLAALLGLTALAAQTDEDRAIAAVEQLKRDKLAAEQERDAARTRAEKAEQLSADAIKLQVDTLLEQAYRDGKLLYGRDGETGKALASPREERLRRIATQDGIKALKAELAEMPVLAPTGRRVLRDRDETSARPRGKGGKALRSVARQLGHDPAELEEYDERLRNGEDVSDLVGDHEDDEDESEED